MFWMLMFLTHILLAVFISEINLKTVIALVTVKKHVYIVYISQIILSGHNKWMSMG